MVSSRPNPSASSFSNHRPMGFAEFVALVASLMALNALAVDMMMPALPDIGRALGLLNDNDRQTVLTAFIVGFGFGQLAVGPLSDRYGRKPVLIYGLLIYSLASVLCAFAQSFDTLLAARFVCGLGAAATRVVIIAVVRDCYAGRQMASVMSLAMMVFIAVPVIAPSVGQVVVLIWPWQSIFTLLAGAGILITIWLALRLPETLRPDNRLPIELRSLGRAFRALIANRQTVGYTLAGGLMQGGMYSFLLSAQQILGEYFGLGNYFPLAFAAAALTISLSSFINARFVGRLGMRVLSHGAAVTFMILAIIMTTLILLDRLSFPSFMTILAAITFLIGLTFANFNALAMEPQGRIAGTASSFLGAVTTFIAVMIAAGVAYAYNGTLVPLAAGYIFVGVSVLAVICFAEKGRLFGPHSSPHPPAK
ncbi:MAG TPA: multidrug effflux MFS transporter [Xanthobacteraceae bacterium]|nr:multidrug effflux MFS transporter [Xanthobacteraceae bacterium]